MYESLRPETCCYICITIINLNITTTLKTIQQVFYRYRNYIEDFLIRIYYHHHQNILKLHVVKLKRFLTLKNQLHDFSLSVTVI